MFKANSQRLCIDLMEAKQIEYGSKLFLNLVFQKQIETERHLHYVSNNDLEGGRGAYSFEEHIAYSLQK